MPQNKTLEVFAKLSREQMQKLRDFVASPYHNPNESVLALFDYLHTLYPHFADEETTDAAILKKGKLKYSAGELRNKMTRLMHLTEDFLALEYQRGGSLGKINTLQAYKKLRLTGHFESLVAKLQKEFEEEKYRDTNYWWRKHRFEDELVEGFGLKIQRTGERTMQPAIESLDYFHSVRKLRYMCDQANIKIQIGNSYADQFKQETLDFIGKADLSDPYLGIYARIYLLCVEEDDEKGKAYFDEIKQIVEQVKNIFPKIEMRAILSYMESYCAHLANKGQTQFLNQYLEIIRFKIEHGMLVQEGEISPLIYKNVITAALKVGEFEWTEKFIRDYTSKLPGNFQEDHYNYNMAQLCYFQGKQGEAIDYLRPVSHNKLDTLFSFAVRKLLMRSEIELGITSPLQEQIDAYKKHLLRKRKEVGEGYAAMLEKFIFFLEKLFKSDAATREKIISDLHAAENFAEKEWLQRMVKEKKL